MRTRYPGAGIGGWIGTDVVHRVLPALVSLAAAAVVAAGCSERGEPTAELPPPYPVTVQGAGDAPLELAAAPQRIVALDAGTAELVSALGAGERLVGVPAGYEASADESVEEVVRATGQIDIARAVALEPDLIVAAPNTDRVDLTQIERQTDAPVYLQPASSIDDVKRAVVELGWLLGQPVEARQLLASIKDGVAAVESRLVDVEPVSAFVDTGFFITIPDRSILADLITRAHGVNVAAGKAGLGPFPLDELVAADPDVYLATSDSDVTIESLRKSPDTAALAAVRGSHFAVLPAELVTRAGPRVAQALEAVALALHPDAFR